MENKCASPTAAGVGGACFSAHSSVMVVVLDHGTHFEKQGSVTTYGMSLNLWSSYSFIGY